jgi:hypothetical protein
MRWYSQSCPVCGGDLHDDLEDEGWVTCFLCARSFVAAEVQALGVLRRLPPRSERELPQAA